MTELSDAYRRLRQVLEPGLADPDDPVMRVREKMHAVHPTDYDEDVKIRRDTLHRQPLHHQSLHREKGDVAVASVTTPEVTHRDSAVMMVHGGAFVSTGIPHYIPYAASLARIFARPVVIFEYRLAPEHHFPAALEDSLTVYRHLVTELGPDKLAVIGDSCGGGIALAMLCRVRDEGLPLPAAYAGLTPWFDLLMSGEAAQHPVEVDPYVDAEWIRRRGRDYAGPDGDPADPLISPLYANLAGLPPLFLSVGGVDITRDDSVRLAERARAAGTEATLDMNPHMIHGFHGLNALAPECRAGCEKIRDFLNLHLN